MDGPARRDDSGRGGEEARDGLRPGDRIASGAVVVFTPGEALWFAQPQACHACTTVAEVAPTLAAIEAAAAGGAHLAGYLAYEAGRAFEPKLAALPDPVLPVPLVWFGAYDAPERLAPAAALERLAAGSAERDATVAVEGFDLDAPAYTAAFERVRAHLACGDIYQANLTLRARGRWQGHAGALFARLLRAQPVDHAALIRLDGTWILSLSPELFLERRGPTLHTRPMKGTAPRGRDGREDEALATGLALDAKSRAENVMIVDLLRNDLARVAEPGSIAVTRLFEVERYATLHQMTSTVEARLPAGAGFGAILAGLFPCGSITRAPKLRAMQILDGLEASPRGVYTGSIGHLDPTGDFRLNVAIRTLVADDDGRFEMGTGSGLVFDSEAAPEYAECALKLRFLTRATPDFSLFETLRLEADGTYLLLERHLARLRRSAQALGFRLVEPAVRAALAEHARRTATTGGTWRVRLELAPDGAITVSGAALSPETGPWRLAVADVRLDPRDPLLAHKTTRRALYDETRVRVASRIGCDEVVFLNPDGQVCEGSISSLFVVRDGRLLTPALSAGLLPGTLREALIETGRAFEANLTLDDLLTAPRLYCGNSLRGLVESRIQSREADAAG